jgi:hypothetical protein
MKVRVLPVLFSEGFEVSIQAERDQQVLALEAPKGYSHLVTLIVGTPVMSIAPGLILKNRGSGPVPEWHATEVGNEE